MSTQIIALVWCCLSLFGLGVNLYALQDARLDLEYVKRWAHVGTRLIVAQANLRRESVRVVVQAVFLCLGIIAMMSDQPRGEVITTRIAISFGFMFAAVLLVIDSAADRHDRKRVLEEIERQHQQRTGGHETTTEKPPEGPGPSL